LATGMTKNRACGQTINNAFLKHRDVDGIYMLGSGWRLLRIVSILEQDLEVPVFYSLAAKLWDVQRHQGLWALAGASAIDACSQ